MPSYTSEIDIAPCSVSLAIVPISSTASLAFPTTAFNASDASSAIFLPLFTLLIESYINISVFFTATELSSASFLISSATTANPFPDSPALAASIAALSAKRFVCSDIL